MHGYEGWIKLYRSLIESTIFKNPRLLKFWIWILCKASHKNSQQRVGITETEVLKGQFIFGRIEASKELNLPKATIYRYLKLLESERMIVAKTNNKFSVITVVNWGLYQDGKEQNEHQMSNKWATNEHQMSTNKNVENVKNLKEIKNIGPFKEIIEYLNEKAGTNFKSTTKSTQRDITARFNEGFKLEDFQKVINKKVVEWKDSEYAKYLRPETLFGKKFEGYLNQPERNECTNGTSIKNSRKCYARTEFEGQETSCDEYAKGFTVNDSSEASYTERCNG